MKVHKIIALICLVVTIPLISPAQSDDVTELYQISIDLRADYGSLSRFYQIDESPERRDRFEVFYNDYRKQLEEYDFKALSQGGKVDYILINRYLDDRLYLLEKEQEEVASMQKWLTPASGLYAIEKKRRRGLKLDAPQVAAALADMAVSVEQSLVELEKPEVVFPRNLTRRASSAIKGQQKALQSVYEFYEGYDPQFTWWNKKPYQKLDSLLGLYASTMSKQIDAATLPPDDGSGIIGNPIGKEELTRQLKHQFIPYSPEELVEIANKEFAWCDAELLKASREMGFGDDWRAAQEKVKMSFVPPGEQPEAMLDLYNQSIEFLTKNDLLTIPPIAEETWRMKMIPPERQLISPFFLGGEVLQISYPTDEMEQEDKMMSMRGNNPHFSRSTVHHELIAGHHLQQFDNRRFKSYRFSRTPFWTEGWALYWELLLWDMDFPRSPEDRVGMLFWRMHRCARIIFSLNYHLGNWTPQECIDYLVERVGHERANAEGEVRRSFTGGYGPLYQIAYMIGGLQFWDLKTELVDSGKMTYKEFHDAVLRENAMPVEMVRALLTDENLKENFKTNWKFYNK